MQVLLKVLGGSRAYGLSHEESDWDFKGCFIHEKEKWFEFEPQINILEEKAADGYCEVVEGVVVESDLTLFEIRSFFNFLIKNNPNVLECLFVKEEDIFKCHASFREVLDSRHIFLSKKTQESFVGYAIAQIKRAQTHRKWLLNPPKKQPERIDFDLPAIPEFKKDQQNAFLAYLARMVEHNKKYFAILEDAPDLLIRDMVNSTPSEQISELGKIFGLDTNFIDLIKREKAYEQEAKNWKSYLNWQKNRNEKRFVLEKKAGYDSKNIMHCIRLLVQAKEILERGDMTVDRSNIDAEYLKEIKDGKYSYEEVIEITNELRNEISAASRVSRLSDFPDEERIKKIYYDALDQLGYY